MPSIAHVGYAICEVTGLFGSNPGSVRDALEDSWGPGTVVTRYGRTWHLSRSYPDDSRRVWFGRIGFVREGDVSTVIWDEENQDFVHQATSSGVVVPFVLDTPTGDTAFQLRPGVVRATTFTGALQSLLNTSRVYRWDLRPLVVQRSFEEWLRRTVQVTDFAFRLERPNPHYHDNPMIETILEDLRLETARLAGKARPGESVDVENGLFRQLLDHAGRKYGRGLIQGFDQEGETQWDSSGGGTVPARKSINSEGDDEILESELRGALLQKPQNLLPLAAGDELIDDESA